MSKKETAEMLGVSQAAIDKQRQRRQILGVPSAARLAASLDRVDEAMISRQESLLRACNLPVAVSDLDTEALLEAMQHDKKVEHGKLRFVLPTKMGHVELVDDVSMDLVRAALTA